MILISELFSVFLVIPKIQFPKKCVYAFVFLLKLKMNV
jgi:hypothetical protein